MIETIFFDNWNTLVEAPRLMKKDADIEIFYNKLSEDGIDISLQEFRKAYKPIARRQIEKANSDNYREPDYEERLNKVLLKLGIDEEKSRELSKITWSTYLSEWPKQTKFFPETMETISSLKERYKLGLITNYMDGPTCRKVFDKLGYDEIFDSLIVSAEIGYRKPSQIIFDAALEDIDSRPETALMVGDSFEADILGAINMGMKNILIDHGYAPRDSIHKANAVIENIGEVKKIIHKL